MKKFKFSKLTNLSNTLKGYNLEKLIKENKKYLIDINLKLKKYFSKPSLNLSLFRDLQDKIEKKININEGDVLLRQSTFWASSITWTLIGGTCFGVVWLSFAKTDEIVIAQGKLEPIKKVIDVQMPLEGIAREILVKEGDLVSKGQTLIKLDNQETTSRIDSIQKILDIDRNILNKYKILYENGAVSELQYLQQKARVIQAEGQLEQSNITLEYQKIIAPENGIVFDLRPKGVGFVGRSSEPIMKIVPTDSLRARIEIENRTIGFIDVGKKVDVSIESYPAGDFGVIKGVLTSIGSDALAPDPQQGKGYRFPAEVTLETQHLVLKNGKVLPLQAGMSLIANIKLRKVSYLQLLLNTFQDKADSLRTL